jgi:hypothetical protein
MVGYYLIGKLRLLYFLLPWSVVVLNYSPYAYRDLDIKLIFVNLRISSLVPWYLSVGEDFFTSYGPFFSIKKLSVTFRSSVNRYWFLSLIVLKLELRTGFVWG